MWIMTYYREKERCWDEYVIASLICSMIIPLPYIQSLIYLCQIVKWDDSPPN